MHTSKYLFSSPPSEAEDGKRLYCSNLTFYQLRKQTQKLGKRQLSAPIEPDVSAITNRQRQLRAKRSPSIDYLDEVNEANWSPESIVNQPKELYEPVCLCLVSRYPFFDILQVCGYIRVAPHHLHPHSRRRQTPLLLQPHLLPTQKTDPETRKETALSTN